MKFKTSSRLLPPSIYVKLKKHKIEEPPTFSSGLHFPNVHELAQIISIPYIILFRRVRLQVCFVIRDL